MPRLYQQLRQSFYKPRQNDSSDFSKTPSGAASKKARQNWRRHAELPEDDDSGAERGGAEVLVGVDVSKVMCILCY